MSDLSWMPRENGLKHHHLWREDIFSTEAPRVMYEKKPILDPKGNPVDGVYAAWVALNNPKHYNSYTTEMVKAVIAGFHRASADTSVVACDIAISSDLAIYGQAGPKHGSAPDGGSSDFLPWMLPMELAMWDCVSYVADGDLVYGEYKTGDAAKEARAYLKTATTDFELLDKEVNKILWTYANLFPGCLIKSVEGVRLKKKFFWDQAKVINRHWLAANMSGEAFLGFGAFNTKKITGTDTIDFLEYRRRLAAGDTLDDVLMAAVLGKPKE